MSDSQKMHILLVESAWGLLEENFNEVLTKATLHDEVLPNSISIPYRNPKTGQWVRLSLEISPLRTSEEGED